MDILWHTSEVLKQPASCLEMQEISLCPFLLLSIRAGSSLVFKDPFLPIYMLILHGGLTEEWKELCKVKTDPQGNCSGKEKFYFLGPHFQKFLAQKK